AIDRNDSFFGRGGDSLLATRMVSRLRAAGVTGVRLQDLFANPHLKDFAATLQPAQEPPRECTLRGDSSRRYEPFPLTEVQRAYWIGRGRDFALGGTGSYWYWEFDGEDVD